MISEYLTLHNDDLSGLVLSIPETSFNEYKKIDIYNNKLNKPLQKIWLKIPSIKVQKYIYAMNKQKQYASITVILHDKQQEIKDLYTLINNVDTKVFSELSKVYKNIQKRSCLTKMPFVSYHTMNMLVPIEKYGDGHIYSINVYDESNDLITSTKTIKQHSYIEAYAKLSEVWVKESPFDYGFKWEITQMKVYPEFNFSECLFGESKSVKKIPTPIHPPHTKQKAETNKSKKLELRPFVPSMNELLSIKSKLKSVDTERPDENKTDDTHLTLSDELGSDESPKKIQESPKTQEVAIEEPPKTQEVAIEEPQKKPRIKKKYIVEDMVIEEPPIIKKKQVKQHIISDG